MDAALGTAQWAVGKALAPVTDGLLEAWGANKNFGPRLNALTMELLLVKATLEIASGKQLNDVPTIETLLQKLRDSAHNAEDLLDELDYFRIHDGLQGTYDAADEHVKGGVHNLVLNARHTAKAVGKLLCFFTCSPAANAGEHGEEDARQRVNGCTWPPARQRARGNSSSAPNTNQADEEDSGCTYKLGKILTCSSFPPVHNDDDSGKSTLCGACMRKASPRKHAEETPKLQFNRVDFSEKMNHIVEQLQLVRTNITNILQSCGRNTILDTSQIRPITTGQITEPKLYGRDGMVNSIIHDITMGEYCGKDLSVLPIVGPGGIGKTTMVQHIYHDQELRNHFQVIIWVCVSLNFNLNKLLEEIKKCIPRVEGEKEGTTEELIEQRLKSKRFLLVLDDIWECINEDDWKRLLRPLKTSQEKGSMILVTTQFQAIAQMVKTTEHSIELEGLEYEDFRELFLAFVFGDGQYICYPNFLLETGDMIMKKLKGFPLAAKTVGRLLRNDLNLHHWGRVLESKEWERQTGSNDIMSALKLSYDYLPFHLQQCFFYSALFPEDYQFSRTELINLWIGLDILQPGAQNQTYEDIAFSNLNDLVTHGFFREEETYGRQCYVMHDLLHDLALKVASHECLSLHRSNVRSVQIQPCIHHLSIIIDDIGHDNVVSGEEFKSELRKLKRKVKVEHLQTLMLFGGMDESFANIFADLFWEANALRVLRLPEMPCHLESILHNFSPLVHLRYLCLGRNYESQMHLPLTISRFYHLRILYLGLWDGSCGVLKDMSNLAKLRCFYIRCEGFELKQLEHLTELRELGIYNLEKIHTREEAAKAKLIEKNYLQRLTLDWDSCVEPHPDVHAVVLESLQPHRDLQELCIIGHGGPSCPTWLGSKFAIVGLQSLHLVGVSWEVLSYIGNMWELRKQDPYIDWFPQLQELAIENCPELLLVTPIPWTKTLRSVKITNVKLLKEFKYSKSFDGARLEIIGMNDLHSLDQVLVFNKETCLERLSLEKCPPLGLKHLLMLTSVKTLIAKNSDGLVGPLRGQLDVEWQLFVEHLEVCNLCGATGRELTELLPHLPTLFKLEIEGCRKITQLVVGVDLQKTTSAGSEVEDVEAEAELIMEQQKEDGVLLFPPHLSDSLWELHIEDCPDLVMVPGGQGGGLQALRSLQWLHIERCPKLLSSWSFSSPSSRLFPSSLQYLCLKGVEGMGTLEPLSNLTSLTELVMENCGEDLRCEGLLPLLTTGGQLSKLDVFHCPRFFAGWNPNLRRVLQDEEGELLDLRTDDAAGLLAAPICSLLSSSLTELCLGWIKEMEHFTKEQEDALHLLASLQELSFVHCHKLTNLPAGLHKLTNLETLVVYKCPAVRSLPKDDLPKSLRELGVHNCGNEELIQQCRGLVGTIPIIKLT